MRPCLRRGLTTALMAAAITATAAPAFADRDHRQGHGHHRGWHHHDRWPPPHHVYRPGYVFAPPPIVYVRPPPPPPPVVPSFSVVIPLR